VVAYLKPQAIAVLDRCEKDWCRVRADEVSGWVRAGALWGTSAALQCHPAGDRRAERPG
jgi:SH3-like domain-containing protein